MTIHLVKLCVGAKSVNDLADWVEKRVQLNQQAGHGSVHDHVTRMHPKREAALLDGGSIYWVIKGMVLVRQRILGLQSRIGDDGVRRCAISLDPCLIATEPQSRRAFQGWRYVPVEDAPKDARKGRGAPPPPELAAELAELGLL